ncbi:DUF6912 family protein [Antribacter gilvus]|uniref:DUF6912 family protein n=1 Tax=Antribacter gilvus TaxID=2304675 RepID=UPI000F7A559B|nr:hypothetical protein [Antribacter gilvus]
MRIYVPATLDELDSAVVTDSAARWTLAPRGAHAVTPALAEAFPDEDEEGLEYIAALEAASDSLALIAARPDVPLQRVVVTVEVPDGVLSVPEAGEVDDDAVAPSAVEVTREVADLAILALHVDEPVAAGDVAAVLAAADEENDAEEAGQVAAESETALDEALQRVTDRDLLWYDWSEVHEVPRA